MSTFAALTHAPEAKPKLLIVDDQAINIQVLHQALSAEFQVFMATSGAKALAISAPHRRWIWFYSM